MSRIIFATGNQNKMREIREIMQGFRVNGEEIEILSMKEAGVYTDIVEDGMTFPQSVGSGLCGGETPVGLDFYFLDGYQIAVKTDNE